MYTYVCHKTEANMTIEKQSQAIICDYCQNNDYYYGDKRSVWTQAKAMGWLQYKDKHF